MKTISFNVIITIITMCNISCNGQPVITEQPKTVRCYSREFNNMEMMNMKQLPGWQLLGGTQWIGNMYCNSIKGVNDKLGANFFMDGTRSYTHSPNARTATSDGKEIFLNVMTAADYLDFVFHRQFPNVKNAKRTTLKTFDMYSEAERRQMEEKRVNLYNSLLQYYQQSGTGSFTQIRQVTVDRAMAEYEWEQNGNSVIHYMEVLLNAVCCDFRSQYLSYPTINWGHELLITATAPSKNNKKAQADVEQMCKSIVWNENYISILNQNVWQGIRKINENIQRIQVAMAKSAIEHNQEMWNMVKETNEYIANTQREVIANRQSTMDRVNQGWRDVLVGVDRYVGVDGKVMEVPVSMGNKVWQSADGGTVYTSDSYMFKPVDNLYDKDGRWQEFRQLQLLK